MTATTVTTAIAFLTFSLSGIPALRIFGFFCALGVALTWILTIHLVPMLLGFMPTGRAAIMSLCFQSTLGTHMVLPS